MRDEPVTEALVRGGDGEMRDRTERLAGQLRERGVERGDLVAVLAERAGDLLAGSLAALDVGASIVPLGPGRSEAVERAISRLVPRVVLRIDGTGAVQWRAAMPATIDAPALPSGSIVMARIGDAGTVLGVAVPPSGIDAILDEIDGQGGAAGTALTVEGRRPELLVLIALAVVRSRGELHVARDAGLPAVLAAARRLDATALCMPLAELTHAELDEAPPLPGLLLTWGEGRFPSESLRRSLEQRSVSWRNLYGFPRPIATTTLARDAISSAAADVHVGRAIAGLRPVVLDRMHKPVPPGVVGELFVDARAWRAIPGGGVPPADPFGLLPTGFTARCRSSGELELRGRRDGWTTAVEGAVHLPDLQALLLRIPGVEECAFDSRDSVGVTAYFSVCDESAAQKAQDLLARAGVEPRRVPSLSLRPTGEVDWTSLEAAPASTAERIREAIRGATDIAAAVEVLAIESVPAAERLPVPPWLATVASAERALPPALREEHAAPPGRLALVGGGPLPEAAQPPFTLGEALDRAAALGEGRMVTCVEPDGATSRRSYASLRNDARRLLDGLRTAGVRPGDHVILQLNRIADFLEAFWASVLGGFAVIPVAGPPDLGADDGASKKLRRALVLASAPTVVTTTAWASAQAEFTRRAGRSDARVVTIEECRRPVAAAAAPPDHVPSPEDLILLMLTSGSTAEGKAVMLSHRNVLCMSKAISRLNGYHPGEVSLNWMPLDHVGGLVMFHVRDVVLACTQIQAATAFVLADPCRWLQLMQDHQVTVSWAPNFAFAAVNKEHRRLEQTRYDLSSVRLLANGGEVVNVETALRFLELLRPHGLSPRAIRPGFGMSETSSSIISSDRLCLGATDSIYFLEGSAVGEPIRTSPRGAALAAVGTPAPGLEMRIVDEADRVLAERVIGRLQVRGPQVMSGYYRDPGNTAAAFTADGWLRTGDLGFISDRQLTVTGREKDLIIVHGLKYGAEEIEAVVEQVPGVAPAHVAACAVDDPRKSGERLAVFFTPAAGTGPGEAPVEPIRRALIARLAINPDFLLPIPADRLPRAELGKIQRSRLRTAFAAGEFDDLVTRRDLASPAPEAASLPAWFFTRIWRPGPPPGSPPPSVPDLVFCTDDECVGSIVGDLAAGGRVVRVMPGAVFRRVGPRDFVVPPGDRAALSTLIETLDAEGVQVERVLHLWTYAPAQRPRSRRFDEAQDLGLFTILHLLQELARRSPLRSVSLTVVGCDAQVTGLETAPRVDHATLPGLLASARWELPWLHARHVDVEPGTLTAERLRCELALGAPGREVAYRGDVRLVPRLVAAERATADAAAAVLPRDGLYLLVGGLGGVGRQLALSLARGLGARLLMVGRTVLPERSSWPRHRSAGGTLGARIEALEELEAAGAQVMYEAVDVTDAPRLRDAIARAEQRWDTRLSVAMNLAGEGTIAQQWIDFERHWITHEARDTFAGHFRTKVSGTEALFTALEARADATVLIFSSVNGVFGGVNVGAYAAASAYCDAAALCRRMTTHPGAKSLAISLWKDTGLAAGAPEQAVSLAAEKGFATLSACDGVRSVLLAAAMNAGHVLIGLDEQKAFVLARLERWRTSTAELHVFVEQPGPAACDRVAEVVRRHTDAPFRVHHVDALPRTAAGEVNRAQLRALASEKAASVEGSGELTTREQTLLRVVRDLLDRVDITVDDDFFLLGGDSILSLQLVARAAQSGIPLTPFDVFEQKTVRRLAALDGRPQSEDAEQGIVAGPVPLTPVQRWFFAQELARPDHFNMPLLLDLPRDRAVTAEALERAIGDVVRHHDALRSRFRRRGEGWEQEIVPVDEVRVSRLDLAGVPDADVAAAVRAFADRQQRSLDLKSGPLVAVANLDLGRGRGQKLLLVVHHLVMDAYSWRILAEDLEAALVAYERGETPRLPRKTSSFKRYAERLTLAAESGELQAELEYWKNMLAAAAPAARPSRSESDTEGAARVFEFSLEERATEALIRKVPGVLSCDVDDLLLTALAWAWRGTGEDRVLVDVETHGRDAFDGDLDLSRTVGWFTVIHPLLLDCSAARSPVEALRTVGAARRQVPNRGRGYGLLRYGGGATPPLDGGPAAEVSFNYLGQLDQAVAASRLFQLAGEPVGAPVAEDNVRAHRIDVVACVLGGGLRLVWKYAGAVPAAAIERLSAAYVGALDELVAAGLDDHASRPAESGLAAVGAGLLDRLADMVEFEE